MKPLNNRIRLSLLIVSFFLFSSPSFAETKATGPSVSYLAIIIDDLGNNLKSGLNALALPGRITYSVLPHRTHSQTLADRGHRLGKEIMLHAPMSTLDNHPLGEGALTLDLNEKQFKDRLRHAILSTPHIRGVNNHMGSALTQNTQAMTWLMDVLQESQLYFVDSRTTHETVAFTLAQQQSVASATRDVFLDHEVNTDSIHRQFKRALAVSKKYGSAIAIGHPSKTTLAYLAKVLPELDRLNVKLLSASDLIAQGIKQRPLPSGFASPLEAPNLDTLVRYLAQK